MQEAGADENVEPNQKLGSRIVFEVNEALPLWVVQIEKKNKQTAKKKGSGEPKPKVCSAPSLLHRAPQKR